MAVDLNEHGGGILLQVGDASTGDATRGLGGRRSAAHVHGNMVLLGQLLLGRGLVERWGVEFGQSILRDEDELLGGSVGGEGLLVLSVLALPEISCLLDGFVQCLDASGQSLDLRLEDLDALLCIGHGGHDVAVFLLQDLAGVLCLVDLLLAITLLAVVVTLLLAQKLDHFVDHLQDLVEVAGTTSECEQHCIHARVLGQLSELESRDSSITKGLAVDLDLEEGRAAERRLEEIESLVVVEDLDGLS
mmetsp:Transcript_44026/g.66507  ORF Transcript_44026/g.66507 Transcript_44026/m.66507 type:complete len:247 (-) Transcript_44026:846-1586(-)